MDDRTARAARAMNALAGSVKSSRALDDERVPHVVSIGPSTEGVFFENLARVRLRIAEILVAHPENAAEVLQRAGWTRIEGTTLSYREAYVRLVGEAHSPGLELADRRRLSSALLTSRERSRFGWDLPANLLIVSLAARAGVQLLQSPYRMLATAASAQVDGWDSTIAMARTFGLADLLTGLATRGPQTAEEEDLPDLPEPRPGVVRFAGLDIAACDGVFAPRRVTEQLFQLARVEMTRPAAGSRLVDVGTGSGAVALASAVAFPRCHVTGTDISARAIACARRNAGRLDLENVEFSETNLLDGVDGEFAAVFANVPYVPGHVPLPPGNDDGLIVGKGADGLDLVRDVAAAARDRLPVGAPLAIQIADYQFEAMRSHLESIGFSVRAPGRRRPEHALPLVALARDHVWRV